MNILIKEIIYPLKDFYNMRKEKRKSELFLFVCFPLLIAVILFIFECFFNATRHIDVDDFVIDMLNQLITVLTLFISFSMAYLSIIITSSSETINIMKEKDSKYYSLQGKPCKLFQVLMCDLTYTLVIEILFLLFIFFQKFLLYMSSLLCIRILISINVCLLVHVLIMLTIIVKNIYFSFWNG